MAKIAFVQNMFFEYLGVMYMSSMLKKEGHAVEIFIVSGNGDSEIKKILLYSPDLIGFSCTTGIHKWALEYAEKIKKFCNAKIIFGGPHPTYFPEIINQGPVDIICRGEGELAILELANKINIQESLVNTLNCWFKIDGAVKKNDQRLLVEDLDTLPFPDRELYLKKYPVLNKSQKVFLGGRGCPFNCTFCFNHSFKELYKGKGRIVRQRSVDSLLKEIKEVREKYNIRTVYMQDDTFILNKEWAIEFAKKYKKEIGLPFICLIRADLADEEIIEQLSSAGCKTVFFGIETGSEERRNLLLGKKVTDKQIRFTAALLKKHKIKFRTYNILGLPGETIEDALKTIKLNADIRTNYPWCSIFYPYPGTELTRYAKENNFFEDSVDTAHHSFFKDSNIKLQHKREIVNLQRLFFYGVKFPWMLPLILKLAKLRAKIIFDLAFLASYAWCYLRSENFTMGEIASIGARNVKTFFFCDK